MAEARESRRLRRASRGRGEAEENGRREDDAAGEDKARDDEQQGNALDDSGGGVFSTLKDTAADAALAVLKPVAKRAATKAAKFAVEKGPELFEDKVLPMVEDAGGPAGLVANLAEGGGPAGALLSRFTGGGDDDEDGDREAGDATGQGRRMPIQQAVDVAAPIEVVYDQFTQFEDWPRFMHRVESVEQKDESTVVFNEKIWGIRRRWEAEIVEQRPDERIVWESVSGTQHVGVVTFHELSDRLTRVEVTIDIDPQGPMEKIARGARFAKRAVRADLHRFKAFIEMHEDETGAWRGEIQDGDVVSEEGDDERYEDEEREEPEAEYEEDEEPEAEEDEEPEAEAEEEPEAEAEEQDEEEQKPKPRSRSRSRSSSNGSSKSESAKPKQSSRRSSSSRAKSGNGSTSRSRSRGGSSKSSGSSSKSKSSSSRAKSKSASSKS